MEYKIVILGDGGTGKSAITCQFLSNHFIIEYDPTIEDSFRKQIMIDNETCLLDILDTAGQEEYSALRDQYYRVAHGFLLVYAINSRITFDKLFLFKGEIDRNEECKQHISYNQKTPIVIVGNKCDLEMERQVSTGEGLDIAKHFHCSFLETSAKTRLNIDECFLQLIRDIRGNNNKHNNKKSKQRKNCVMI